MRKILAYMAVDRAVAYTLATRSWSLVSSVVTLILVVRYLTPDEQGYFYTFVSLLALQILFELGMSVVVMQFASHEMANLVWAESGVLEGDSNSKSRLRSLMLLVTKLYGVIAILLIIVILPIGWAFFSTGDLESSVHWRVAWAWLVLIAAVNILIMPFLAMLEGCNRVTEIALLRMKQNIIGSLLAWVALVSGGGLLALPAMNTGLALVALIWLWRTKNKFLIDLFAHTASCSSLNWRAEIWPFQWRIALSWLSGFFIFQLFTPVLFAYRGAVEAGQMGMSISIANALMAIAVAWINTKSPGFGALVARGDYRNLDRSFALTLSRSLSVMTLVGVGLCLVNYFIHTEQVQYANRILDPLPFSLLMLATIFAYVTYAQASYLRAHKEEPFMLISLISAAIIGSLTVVLGKHYGATGLMAIYVAVYGFIGVGWGSKIFISKRREWQNLSDEMPSKKT